MRTKRDAVLFAWRAHNRVNARLAAAEARGDDVGSGDPSYPKVQWPTAEQCEACRAPVVGLKRGDEPRWNEEETYKFLAAYFHGIGAPRLTVTNPNPKAEDVAALGASEGVGEVSAADRVWARWAFPHWGWWRWRRRWRRAAEEDDRVARTTREGRREGSGSAGEDCDAHGGRSDGGARGARRHLTVMARRSTWVDRRALPAVLVEPARQGPVKPRTTRGRDSSVRAAKVDGPLVSSRGSDARVVGRASSDANRRGKP